jgi:ribosomal-protein-alanine N-acetyltransferase
MKIINLRSINESDTKRIYELCQDPEISENTGGNIPFPYKMTDAEFFIHKVRLSIEEKKAAHFAICEPESDLLIGVISIDYIDWKHRKGTIGYWMGKDYRNKGYMTEALKQVIHFGLYEKDLNRVQAIHFNYNPSSGIVMQKAGMIKEAVMKNYYIINDKPVDVALYAATK